MTLRRHIHHTQLAKLQAHKCQGPCVVCDSEILLLLHSSVCLCLFVSAFACLLPACLPVCLLPACLLSRDLDDRASSNRCDCRTFGADRDREVGEDGKGTTAEPAAKKLTEPGQEGGRESVRNPTDIASVLYCLRAWLHREWLRGWRCRCKGVCT